MKTLQLGTLALVASSLLAVSGAHAGDARKDADRIAVQYGDLNIHSTAGAKVLYSRIKKASKQACNVESYRELGSLVRYSETQSCYADALDSLVARIDSAALKKLHHS